MKRKPFIFIGSSTEGKDIAEAIQYNLKNSCESQIWDQGLFGLSDGTLESLIKSLDKFDFAVFVITGDDLVESRAVVSKAPRDNVILEIGLFMGALGRERVYLIVEKSAKPKLPTDLAGITIEPFERPTRGTLRSALGPAATVIKDKISEIGLRPAVESAKNNYKNDLKVITTYLKDNKFQMISFEKLQKNVLDKFDRDYALKLIEANPGKIRKAKLKGGKEGIKILTLPAKTSIKLLIWEDTFDATTGWHMNYWESKNPSKTNIRGKGTMIFKATADDLVNDQGFYGAFFDLTDKIVNEKIYEIECRVSSTPNATMGFQLWVHDINKEKTISIIEPAFPKTPSVSGETFKIQYRATETNSLRVHLHCKAGIGEIKVSKVSVYQI